MDGPLRERTRVLNPRRRSPLEPRDDTDSQRLRRTLRPPQVRRQSRCYRCDARKSIADRDRAHEVGRVLSFARRRTGLVGAVDTPGRFLRPDSLLHGFVAGERRRRARLVDRGGPQSAGRPGNRNAGQQWHTVVARGLPTRPCSVTSVSAAGANVAWVVARHRGSNTALFQTGDGGRTWHRTILQRG
jgi:hypothetical protein